MGDDVNSWITESLQGIIARLFDLLLDVQFGNPVSRNPNYPSLEADPGVMQLQNVFNPLVLFLTTLGILLAAVRLLWTRRLDPMMDLVRGLITVIVATFAGLFLIYVLGGLSDSLTLMVLESGQHERPDGGTTGFLPAAKEVYPSIMRVGVDDDDLGFGTEAAREAITYMIGLAVILGLIAQMVVLALLKAVIYLIACLLPLAAASTMIPGLRIFPKVIGWLFACLLYKPLLLLIYLSGLVILASAQEAAGENEAGLFRYLMGAAIMLLATGALPVLMKLMSSGSVWAMALIAGGASSSGLLGGGGGGGGGGGENAGGGTQGDPASYSAAGSNSGTGVAQAAAGANERAAGVARNLDAGGDGGGVVQAGDAGQAAGAADRGTLGTLGGAGGGAAAAAAGVPEAGGALDGGTGGDLSDPSGGGADGGGPGALQAASAAPGASESVGSTTSGTETASVSASGAVEGGVEYGGDPGGPGAPQPGGGSYGGTVSEGASLDTGGAAPTAGPGGAAGADAPDGADGRMV